MLSNLKKKRKKRKKTNKEKEIHLRTGQLSDSDSTIHDHEESRRPCNKQVKRSNDFLVVLKIAKSSTTNLIDLGQALDTSNNQVLNKEVQVSRGRTYWAAIKETVNCTCEFLNQKTPLVSIFFIYISMYGMFVNLRIYYIKCN